MDTETIQKVIEHNLSLPTDQAMLWPALVAPTGAGKTWSVRALAKKMGLKVVPLLLATMMPEDIGGLPKIRGDVIHWALPDWVKGRPVLLFLDEFDKARPESYSAILTLLAERRLRDHPLPEGSAIVLGMQPVNPSEFLSDETGRALAARIVWQATGYDWPWAEKMFSLNGLTELMPDSEIPEMPILPRPSIRQVDWCSGFVRAHIAEDTLNEAVLKGIIPVQFIKPLIEIIQTDINKLSVKSVVAVLNKNISYMDKLTIPEIAGISFAVWQDCTPEVVARMYERLLIECSSDEAAAIHKAAAEQIYAKAAQNDDKIQLCGKATQKQVIAAFEAMIIRVAKVYRSRGEHAKEETK